jgi:hypothetical protein
MGILDEAIREHLELKRRRGATDSELQRLEDEAFGPPSRPGEPDFPEQEGAAAQSGNGVAREGAVAEAPVAPEAPTPPAEGEQVEEPDEPDEQGAAEAPTAIFDQGPDAELETGEPPIEALDTVEHALPEEEAESEVPPAEEPDSEPAEELEPSEEEPGPAADGEEALEEGESRGEEESEDEDVLADTPEFLRDAPEDDELWFEQGKPKDFDF